MPTNDARVAAALNETGGGTTTSVSLRAGGSEIVGADGSLFPRLVGEARQQKLIELAMPPEPGESAPGPFADVSNPDLLVKAAAAIEQEFNACVGQPPDDVVGLAWRQLRASCLHLLQEAAVRVAELSGDVKSVLNKAVEVIKQEPHRGLRDFAFEGLLKHSEANKLPSVAEAKALLYPEAPPYKDWPTTIKVVRYCDDSGSKIEDNIWFFKEMMGAKHTEHPDGSHTFVIKKRGAKHDIEVLIPPKSAGLNIVEKIGDGQTHVIEYCGHAGHGNFFEAALANGSKGTGAGQVMAAYQCWGEGNTETLERQIPDLQYLSTTEMTTDNYDFVMQQQFFLGIMQEQTWDQMLKATIKNLKSDFAKDIRSGELKVDTHYIGPTHRSRLLTHYDRDGDGTRDGEDHIFNVVYPRRVDTSGGYDPVVQQVPRFALDGGELSKSVNALTLILRYDHLLSPADEKKVVWDPNKWQPGGFFSPENGDLRAFRFTKTADGEVRVALSTLFAQTTREDLQRMLGIEAGLWIGKEAGLGKEQQGILAAVMLQRLVEGQGEWFSQEDGLLDEFWAEEQMLFSRYGLSGFSIAEITQAADAGHADHFSPQHFAQAAKALTGKGLDKAVDRNPTRVGKALAVPEGGVPFVTTEGVDMEQISALLNSLGAPGKIESATPRYLALPMPATNLVVTMSEGGKTAVYGLGIDSAGHVLAAAELTLDFSKKIEGALCQVLARAAIAGGLTVGDVQSAITTAKAQHADWFDAFVAAARDIRQHASPAACLDNNQIYALQGLVDQAKLDRAQQVLGQMFPAGYQCQTERLFFQALASSKELEGKMGPTIQAFNDAILAGDGSAEAWKNAAQVLADALPAKLSLAPGTNQAELLLSLERTNPIGAVRAKLMDAIGLKPSDIGRLVIDSVTSDAAEKAQMLQVFSDTFAKTQDVIGGMIAARDVFCDTQQDWYANSFVEALGFERFGLFTDDSAETGAALERVKEHSLRRSLEHIAWCVAKAAGASPDRDAFKKTFRDALQGGASLADAVKLALGKLDKAKASEVLNAWRGKQYLLPPGFDGSGMLANIASTLSLTRSEFALQTTLVDLADAQHGLNAALLRRFRQVFLDTQQATGSLAKAISAAAKTLFAHSVESRNFAYDIVTGSFVLDAAERDEVAIEMKPLTTVHAMCSPIVDAMSLIPDAALAQTTMADIAKKSGAMGAAANPVEALLSMLESYPVQPIPEESRLRVPFYMLAQIGDSALQRRTAAALLRIVGTSAREYAQAAIEGAVTRGQDAAKQAMLRTIVAAAFSSNTSLCDSVLAAVRGSVALLQQNVGIYSSDWLSYFEEKPAGFDGELALACSYVA